MGKHGPASISKKLRVLSEPNTRSMRERERENRESRPERGETGRVHGRS